ncbi:MAG: hypothetical protein JO131_08010 [Gammaproteobacteria bacterium]|nr:hypothetical protein [Gammaproteobacteria bacterium]
MQSYQGIIENYKNDEKKENSFDLGPLWSINHDLTLDDFKKCVINKKSLDHLVTVIKRKMTQQFAIYGRVKKQETGPSTFYVFFQPSLGSFVTQEKRKVLEEIFQTTVVQASKQMAGIVHPQTKAVCIEEAKTTDPILSEFLENSTSEYEVGLSCWFNLNYPDLFEFNNRSTMNYSSFDYNVAAAQACFFPVMNFDVKAQDFYKKKYSLAVHYSRSAMPEIEDIIRKAMSLSINQRLNKNKTYLSPKVWTVDHRGRTDTQRANLSWNQNYRYNKKKFAKALESTIFVATGLRDEKPSATWTQLSDTGIVLKTLEVAEENNVNLNLNKQNYSFDTRIGGSISSIAYNTNGATSLMFACRKGPLSLVKSLVEYKANPLICDDDGHDASWYAQTNKKMDIYKYIQNTQSELTEEQTQQLHRLRSMFIEMKHTYLYQNKYYLPQKKILKEIDDLFDDLETKNASINRVTIMTDFLENRANTAKKRDNFCCLRFFRKNSLSVRLNKLVNDFLEKEKLILKNGHSLTR